MKTTWVVVADEAVARILEKPNNRDDLVPVEELTDPSAHAKESELHHGPHGRRAGGGSSPQATVSAGDSERHRRAHVFAARIAHRLAEGQRNKRYDELHLLAAPRMLGCLRGALDKDVMQESNAQLTRRVFGSQTATS